MISIDRLHVPFISIGESLLCLSFAQDDDNSRGPDQLLT